MTRRLGLPGLAFLGLALLLVALTAHLTGLDPENNWGPARRQVLTIGLGVLAAAMAVWLRDLPVRAAARLSAAVGRFLSGPTLAPIIRSLAALARKAVGAIAIVASQMSRPMAPVARWLVSRPGRPALVAAGLVFCLAVPVAAWYASVGYWSEWPLTGHYYDDLAQAFRSGQLHLLETPDPALLALDDPYEFERRRHVPAPWDVVLYEGKFYLYWGPVPALFLAAWKTFSTAVIGDNVLVFAFVLGTVLFSLLTLVELWNGRFRELSAGALVPSLLTAAFAHPLPWLLNRPAVYEASIAAGQCFLMAGLFFSLPALLRCEARGWRLALASASWILAVGSRATLAPVALFWTCLTAWVVVRRIQQLGRRGAAGSALHIALPILIGCLALGWYNAQRFGSPLEFGVRYQLTGMDLHDEYTQVFSPGNILVNLYNYLLRPVRTLAVFPWLKPAWGVTAVPLLTWLGLRFPAAAALNPPLYYAEKVTGLVYALPYGAFALVAVGMAMRRVVVPGASRSPSGPSADSGNHASAEAIVAALTLAAALAFGPALLFVVATARYLADVVPTLVCLASVGAWEWVARRNRHSQSSAWVVALMWLAALASVVVSLLLAVTGYDMRFERLNPELFDRIVRFFAW